MIDLDDRRPSAPARVCAAAAPDGTTRATAARYLLTPAQLGESLAMAAPPSLRNAVVAGMQATLAVVVALVCFHHSPWPQLVGFGALGALASLFGRYASRARRRRTVFLSAFLLAAATLATSAAAQAGASPAAMVLVLALMAGVSTVAVSSWGLGGPGAVIVVFAAGAALGAPGSWEAVFARAAATAGGGMLAWIICALTDRLRHEEPAAGAFPSDPPRPMAHRLIAAGRIAVGAAVAALLAHAAGWQHPSWAAIGATAVMQGGHLHITMSRALQRMAGTVVGAGVAGAILAQSPSFWVVVGLIALFQFVTEIIIGYNYALGQITVTPMALLMTHLAAPAMAGNMAIERVFDTVAGAAAGIVLAVLFSSLDDRAHLARHRGAATRGSDAGLPGPAREPA
ncbi:FUSC family protein [Pigmentiphaga sp.]|uniref:FUSC family protein n=1 Tax=Pigmentiphaga sp. TaxID=1977564 RepID=UPI0025E47B0E|nr:FUSC family protein [Pigmentiphaga sp.]